MRKWLPGLLAIACIAAATPFATTVAVFAGEEPMQIEQSALDQLNQVEAEQLGTDGEEGGEEFSPYISLDEIENLTPTYADADLKPEDAENAARTAAADKEVEGKTKEEMTDAERSGASYLWADLLFGKSFVLETLNSEPYRGARPVTLSFDGNGKLSGRICNAFQAHPEFTGMMFKSSEIATSRMACPDRELAKLEQDFLKSLESGISYFSMGDGLELRRDALVMVFRPGTAPAPQHPDAGAPVAEQPVRPVSPASAPVSAEPGVFAPVTPPTAPPTAVVPVTPPAVSVVPPSPVGPIVIDDIVEVVDPSGPVEPIGDIGEKDLAGRKFVLTHVDGQPFSPDMGEQPYIQFDQGMRISGKACNNFRGPGILQDDILTVENAASTMMLCVDAKLTEYEADLYRLLRGGMHMDLNGRELTLSGEGREFLYEEL